MSREAGGAPGGSRVVAQTESAVLRSLSSAIHDLKDPRVPVVVTVERVKVSGDLQHAKVWVSAIGDMPDLLAALTRASGFLQRRLAQDLNLRRTPSLSFLEANDLPELGPPG